jgi:hypothetical protein
MKFKNMATMASWLLSTFDVFLAKQNKHQPWEEEQNKK